MTQIYLRTFSIPVLLAVVIIGRWNSLSETRLFFEFLFFASILFAKLLSDIKYIQHLAIDNNTILIKFRKYYGKEKSVLIQRSEISKIHLSKVLSVWIWTPSLDIKVNGEWMNFNILTKSQYNYIQQEISTPKLNIAN